MGQVVPLFYLSNKEGQFRSEYCNLCVDVCPQLNLEDFTEPYEYVLCQVWGKLCYFKCHWGDFI